MGIQSELEKIRNEFEGALMRAGSLKDIEDIKVKYLGRKGDLTGILKAVATLPKEERREAGKQANLLKNELTEKLGTFTSGKKTEMSDKREALDVTMPGISSSRGTLHPLTQVMEKINDIFRKLGGLINSDSVSMVKELNENPSDMEKIIAMNIIVFLLRGRVVT